jgi:hypothetical protein
VGVIRAFPSGLIHSKVASAFDRGYLQRRDFGVMGSPMRIKGIDPNDPPELVRPVFQRSLERYGRVITPSLVMARRPEVLMAATRLGQAIDGSKLVEPRLKTLASLRAAQMIGCPF